MPLSCAITLRPPPVPSEPDIRLIPSPPTPKFYLFWPSPDSCSPREHSVRRRSSPGFGLLGVISPSHHPPLIVPSHSPCSSLSISLPKTNALATRCTMSTLDVAIPRTHPVISSSGRARPRAWVRARGGQDRLGRSDSRRTFDIR